MESFCFSYIRVNVKWFMGLYVLHNLKLCRSLCSVFFTCLRTKEASHSLLANAGLISLHRACNNKQ